MKTPSIYFSSLAAIFLLFLVSSCSVEPSPINYGSDACDYCKMNIVDQQHAAEIVTKKGKVFKYDAIECMTRAHGGMEENTVALFLVNTFDSPKELVDASSVSYIISPGVASPMGANLSAFIDKNEAEKVIAENGGDLYDWDIIKYKFSSQYISLD